MESPQSLRSRATAALKPLGALAFVACSGAAHPQAVTSVPVGAARAVLSQIVSNEIASGHIPGAIVLAGSADGPSWQRVEGKRMLRPRVEPMTADTVFDLASLTKVVATTTAIMQLVERGKLDLAAPAARYWPAFGANGKTQITVQQLLSHTSGLPAEPPSLTGSGHGTTREALLRSIANIEPVAMPDERIIYSDVNFVVLGELVVQHDLAAEHGDVGVHDAPAVLRHLLERATAAERLFVERDRGVAAFHAEMHLDWRRVGSESHALLLFVPNLDVMTNPRDARVRRER